MERSVFIVRRVPRAMRREIADRDRGSAMILVLMFFMLVMAIGTSTAALAMADLRGAGDAQQAGAALNAAEAGVSQAVTYIRFNGTRTLRCYPATCTNNPWNPTRPVSGDLTGGGHWVAYITPIPPNTDANPGSYLVHSTGTAGGPAQRIIETQVDVTPFGLPIGIFARQLNLGGSLSLQQINVFSTGCVYKRAQVSVVNPSSLDPVYNIPAGVHSSQIITESQGNGQFCPSTNKPIHGGLLGLNSLLPCNSSYPYDQDKYGGSLLNLPGCSAALNLPGYLPRDIDGDGNPDVNGSYLGSDAALFKTFGIKRPALTNAQIEQLRVNAQAQGTYFTSADLPNSWTNALNMSHPTSTHAVLFFDLSSGQTVNLDPLGSSIWARARLSATDPLCIDASLLIVVMGGNAKLNSNSQLAASLYLGSGAPNGNLQKANGTSNYIGMLYSDSMDLTGNFNVSLDPCFVANQPPGLFDVTPGRYRELDR
jgi:hypothetical protein